jgi:MraZ protein
MFIGEYLHTLDPKNRLSLPAKFRKELGRQVVLTRGLDHCLYVYPKKAWESGHAKRYAEGADGTAAGRGLARLFLAGAMEAEVDGAGRVLVPEHLVAFAKLKSKTVVVGVANRVEIWEERAWQEYTAKIEREADSLAERLGEK